MTQMSAHKLVDLGMGNFDGSLYLFPVAWFDDIPDGMWVTTVIGEQVQFSKQTSSRDQRFGWLAFGVRAVV